MICPNSLETAFPQNMLNYSFLFKTPISPFKMSGVHYKALPQLRDNRWNEENMHLFFKCSTSIQCSNPKHNWYANTGDSQTIKKDTGPEMF